MCFGPSGVQPAVGLVSSASEDVTMPKPVSETSVSDTPEKENPNLNSGELILESLCPQELFKKSML